MNANPNPLPDFQHIFESAPGLNLVLDPQFSIVAVSNAYLQATMTRREFLIGKNIFEAFPDNPDDAKADGVRNLRASLEHVRSKLTPHKMPVQRYDIRRPAEEGGQFEVRYWSPLNAPVLGPQGQLLYIVHKVLDVTEQVRLEREAVDRNVVVQELTASERKFRAFLESAPEAMVISNQDGRIELVNSRAVELFGYAKEELIGLEIEQLIPVSMRHEHVRHRQEYMKAPVLRTLRSGENFKARLKDGAEIHVEVTLSPIETDAGLLILTAIRDIRERLRLAEQTRQSQKMEAMGRLTGGVAHDFNNLLTIILGHGNLISSRQGLPAEVKNHVQVIQRTAERAAMLTKQLLQFSRQQVLQPKILNLSEYILDTSEMLRRLLGEEIDLQLNLDPSPTFVKLDPGQFQQVLLNLAVNAKDAMPTGGALSIHTSRVDLDDAYAQLHPGLKPGSYALMAFSDTGTGMDEKTRTRIFEPFFTTKGIGAGTGLGLATVHGIVNQSGGHIWVYSEPGRGTTFKTYFPRTDETGKVATPAAVAPTTRPCTETILIVEDEVEILKLLQSTLEQQGYRILTAVNGQEALQVSEAHPGAIHLLLTDVVIPKLGGGELAKTLAARRPGLKCLYMSGYTNDTIVRHGVTDEGATFIEKPFSPTDVASKIRDLLDAAPS
ncbi:MAG: PAS domain S-box protein [Planctomycetes bacterium]|nr:PAS domain S-box protein [Planctomycetota bacterium]